MHIDNAQWDYIVSVVDISAQCIALATGLGQLHFTGKKQKVGWMIGLIGQPFWLIFEAIKGAWPLMILTIVFTVKTYKNYQRWKRDDEQQVAHPGECSCSHVVSEKRS